MSYGIKHLVTCRCVLPQFKRMEHAPQHQFVVFSTVDDQNNVKPKFSQCNNCGIIHKVTEINRSEIPSSRESMPSLPTIDDIRSGMAPKLADLLDANRADIATWEAAQFIYDNERWGDFVVLTSDEEEGLRQGKYVRIMGKSTFKVETFTREEVTK